MICPRAGSVGETRVLGKWLDRLVQAPAAAEGAPQLESESVDSREPLEQLGR